MSQYARPLRSMLFVPGNRAEWFDKAVATGADAIVIDLSDAVPLSEVEAARRNVRAFLSDYLADGSTAAVLVRPNEVSSPLFEPDLAAVIDPHLYGVMLPLVNHPAEVTAAIEVIDRLEKERAIEPGKTVVVPSLETASSVYRAYDIAAVSERIEHVGAGASEQGDIARSLGYRWSPEGSESFTYRAMALVAVRAAGVAYPISGLWSRIADLDGLAAYATQTRDLGYTGMMAIHPSHVAVINEVFSPSEDEIAEWQEILLAIRSAQEHGMGAVAWRGKLLDEAHVRTATHGLEYARRLGLAG